MMLVNDLYLKYKSRLILFQNVINKLLQVPVNMYVQF
jgi:hypothetical protein